jgi:hypothetical protein
MTAHFASLVSAHVATSRLCHFWGTFTEAWGKERELLLLLL